MCRRPPSGARSSRSRRSISHPMESGYRVGLNGQIIPRDIITRSSAPMTARRSFVPNCRRPSPPIPSCPSSPWRRKAAPSPSGGPATTALPPASRSTSSWTERRHEHQFFFLFASTRESSGEKIERTSVAPASPPVSAAKRRKQSLCIGNQPVLDCRLRRHTGGDAVPLELFTASCAGITT